MRRVDARLALALVGAAVLLTFGAWDTWLSTTHAARSDAASHSPSIGSGSERSAQSATEAFREPDYYAAVGRSASDSSRPPIGSVALAAMVAARCAFRRRAVARLVRPDFFLVSCLRSRAPPALSLI
jgi:hypothetical protein